jgi:hypothetical protein
MAVVGVLGALLLPVPSTAAGLCGTFFTYLSNSIVTSTNLNGNFVQAATTNSTPQCVQGDSATLTQMKTTVDPFPAQVESLATTLEGELQRIRFVLKNISGGSQWYTYSEVAAPTGSSLMGSVVNVKRMGAKGDGVTDDTAAIQAAWDVTPRGGTLYIPCGKYVISSPGLIPRTIFFGSNRQWTGRISGCGGATQGLGPGESLDQQTELSGNFAGAIFDFTGNPSSTSAGSLVIEGMAITNNHTTAGYGIRIKGCIGCAFQNLQVHAWRPIFAGESGFSAVRSFSVTDNSISCNNNLASSGAVGIGHANHVSGGKVSGCGIGIIADGTSNTVVESIDIEVNDIGVLVGADSALTNTTCVGCVLQGLGFEANNTAVRVSTCTACTFSTLSVQGTVNSPTGDSEYGFRVTGNCQFCTLLDSSFGGSTGYKFAAISYEGSSGTMTFTRVNASNPHAGGKKVWNMVASLTQYTFQSTNFSPHEADALGSSAAAVIQRSGNFQWLGQVNFNKGYVEGKNLVKVVAVPVRISVIVITQIGRS